MKFLACSLGNPQTAGVGCNALIKVFKVDFSFNSPRTLVLKCNKLPAFIVSFLSTFKFKEIPLTGFL